MKGRRPEERRREEKRRNQRIPKGVSNYAHQAGTRGNQTFASGHRQRTNPAGAATLNWSSMRNGSTETPFPIDRRTRAPRPSDCSRATTTRSTFRGAIATRRDGGPGAVDARAATRSTAFAMGGGANARDIQQRRVSQAARRGRRCAGRRTHGCVPGPSAAPRRQRQRRGRGGGAAAAAAFEVRRLRLVAGAGILDLGGHGGPCLRTPRLKSSRGVAPALTGNFYVVMSPSHANCVT